MFGLGPTELIIIAIIVLLIFGAKRLPDIGKGLGAPSRSSGISSKILARIKQAIIRMGKKMPLKQMAPLRP